MWSNNQERDRNKNSSSGSAIFSTLAAVGIGAIAAAGAYFVGKTIAEEEAEAKCKAQQHLQQRRHEQEQNELVRRLESQYRFAARNTSTDEDDDPKGSQSSDGKDSLERECVICSIEFETLKRRDAEIVTTPCGHIFCADCITRWIRNKAECPTCKQPVLPGQTLRIFL